MSQTLNEPQHDRGEICWVLKAQNPSKVNLRLAGIFYNFVDVVLEHLSQCHNSPV